MSSFPKILRLKSLGNSWGNSLISNDLLPLHLWWKETTLKSKKELNYFVTGCRLYIATGVNKNQANVHEIKIAFFPYIFW